MRYPTLLFLCLLVIAPTGCSKKKIPPPPLEPARVVMEIEAASDINPNSTNRPSPVVLRIYQLKGFKKFDRADFMSLYIDDENMLGSDLVSKQEFFLKPDEKRTIFFEPDPSVHTVGVLALFRDVQQPDSQWKAATGIKPNAFRLVQVTVSGTSLMMR